MCIDGKCGECCRTMRFELHDFDEAYWVELHGVKVVSEGKFLYAEFPIKCKKLKDNLCSIYENRPDLCRRFVCKTLSK
jgi:Fe-S-cluster containining protein